MTSECETVATRDHTGGPPSACVDSDDLARHSLRPTLQAAVTIRNWDKETIGDLELLPLINELSQQTRTVIGGDLARAEAMLTAQAHTLDAVFNTLMRRAINAKRFDLQETYLRLGLRAQKQAVSTLATLAGIKNPKVVSYLRTEQMNLAHNQQVNNQVHAEPVYKKPAKSAETELLEQQDGERLDRGATRPAADADISMATVGAVDRPQDS